MLAIKLPDALLPFRALNAFTNTPCGEERPLYSGNHSSNTNPSNY
jgi:hypothetical protein